MATIEKRKLDDGTTSYRVKVRLKGYPQESATFSRLTDAREWVQKTEADMKAGRHFGASKRHTLIDLIDSYEKSAQHKALKSGKEIRARLDWWRKQYGSKLLQEYILILVSFGLPYRLARILSHDRLQSKTRPTFTSLTEMTAIRTRLNCVLLNYSP